MKELADCVSGSSAALSPWVPNGQGNRAAHWDLFNKATNPMHVSLPHVLITSLKSHMCVFCLCVFCIPRYACGDQRTSSDAGPHLPLCLWQDFFIVFCMFQVSWSTSFWRFPYPRFPSPCQNTADYRHIYHLSCFYVGSGDLKSGLYMCVTSIFTYRAIFSHSILFLNPIILSIMFQHMSFEGNTGTQAIAGRKTIYKYVLGFALMLW